MVVLADIQRVFQSQAQELSALGITIPGKCTHTRRIDEKAERTCQYYIATTAQSHAETKTVAYMLLEDQPVPAAFRVSSLQAYIKARLNL
jgi:hypothetical protein